MDDKKETGLTINENQPQGIEAVKERVELIRGMMAEILVPGIHYGNIPGIDKKSLSKAGAEQLGVLFRMAPKYERERIEFDGDHIEYLVICRLYSIDTGMFLGEAHASCTTKEKAFRYRNAQRVCPECNQATVFQGKPDKGGGYYCWNKNGGCGAKFPDGDSRIEGQQFGKIENPDLPDEYNGVLKRATKRAHTSAIITATGASDVFTMDMDEATFERPMDTIAKFKAEILVDVRKYGLLSTPTHVLFEHIDPDGVRFEERLKLCKMKGWVETDIQEYLSDKLGEGEVVPPPPFNDDGMEGIGVSAAEFLESENGQETTEPREGQDA